jgi:hypothetical protein
VIVAVCCCTTVVARLRVVYAELCTPCVFVCVPVDGLLRASVYIAGIDLTGVEPLQLKADMEMSANMWVKALSTACMV